VTQEVHHGSYVAGSIHEAVHTNVVKGLAAGMAARRQHPTIGTGSRQALETGAHVEGL
jgi:hypothetical protein